MKIKILFTQRSQRCAERSRQEGFPPSELRGVPPVVRVASPTGEATGVRRNAEDKRSTLAAIFDVLIRKIAILACLLLLVSCQAKSQLENNQAQVKVARVVSGQSLEVLGMAEQPNLISQVRLIGVDTPDLRQRPWGDGAKELLEKLVGDLEKPVTLEFDIEAKDKIGRTLAYVWKEKPKTKLAGLWLMCGKISQRQNWPDFGLCVERSAVIE